MRKKTWTKIVAACALVMTACALVGCARADAPVEEGLPGWADEEAFVAQVREAADALNARDYEAVAARFPDGDDVTAEQIADGLGDTLASLGDFQSYGETSYLHGESNGRSYATAIQQATYANGDAEFRISFFEDGTLAGFYFLDDRDSSEDGSDSEEGSGSEGDSATEEASSTW